MTPFRGDALRAVVVEELAAASLPAAAISKSSAAPSASSP